MTYKCIHAFRPRAAFTDCFQVPWRWRLQSGDSRPCPPATVTPTCASPPARSFLLTPAAVALTPMFQYLSEALRQLAGKPQVLTQVVIFSVSSTGCPQAAQHPKLLAHPTPPSIIASCCGCSIWSQSDLGSSPDHLDRSLEVSMHWRSSNNEHCL